MATIDGIRTSGAAMAGRRKDKEAREAIKRRIKKRDDTLFLQELKRIQKEHGYE